ncbi:MAG: ion transporter [Fibrobacter sp.]|nr:ion transporter [Fibrobacter sp.]
MSRVVESKWFQLVVMIFITTNAVVLGLETVPSVMNSCGKILDVIDSVCLGVFAIEIIMRIVAGRGRFFLSAWNWFDVLVVAVSFIPVTGCVSSLRVVRLLKQFRAMRLVSSVKTMQVIVNAIFKSIPSLGYAGLLMLVTLYIYSVIGVNLYSDVVYEEIQPFADIGTAMLTLVITTTFEGWGDLLRGLMVAHPYAWIYLISFIIISALIMLNIVVGIVVNFVSESYESKTESSPTTIVAEVGEIQKHLDLLKKSLR